jgi:membrane associated rhomboid family serine protease
MTQAPVGFHCPECLVAGAAAVPRPRTVFGGELTREGRVTTGIIGTCAALFVAITLLDLAGGLARWGMQPLAIAIGGEWFRLFSSIFLHAGWLHLGFNMYVLFLLGPPLERVLGHGRFLVLFVVSGLGGSVASYCFSAPQTLSVGASGAIFGLMAAWIVVGRRLDRDVSQVLVLLAINVVLGFLVRGIDWRAHLGGAATGAAVALILTTGRGLSARSHLAAQVGGTLAIMGVLLALTLWRTSALQDLFLG